MAKAKQQAKGSKPSYMTTYEAADFLGFTAGTLRVWRSQGKGPNYYKVGSTVRTWRQKKTAPMPAQLPGRPTQFIKILARMRLILKRN